MTLDISNRYYIYVICPFFSWGFTVTLSSEVLKEDFTEFKTKLEDWWKAREFSLE